MSNVSQVCSHRQDLALWFGIITTYRRKNQVKEENCMLFPDLFITSIINIFGWKLEIQHESSTRYHDMASDY